MPLQSFLKESMSAHCCDHDTPGARAAADPRYRRILVTALVVNAMMFALELGAGVRSGSASLLADAIDFLGDAANYGLSLWVLGMALAWRARAALVKGASMLAFGVFGTGSAWPDLAVAAVMATLAITGGWSIVQQARQELAGEARGCDATLPGR